jgi:hypothetical protein
VGRGLLEHLVASDERAAAERERRGDERDGDGDEIRTDPEAEADERPALAGGGMGVTSRSPWSDQAKIAEKSTDMTG